MSDGFNRMSLFDSQSIELFTFDLERCGGIACYRNCYEQTGLSAFDLHFELEIGIVLTGALERNFAGQRARLQAGQVWLHGPWEPHGFTVLTPPCDVVDLVIDPVVLLADTKTDWIAPFFTPPEHRIPAQFVRDRGKRTEPAHDNVSEIAVSLHNVFSEQGPNAHAWVRHLTQEILLNVFHFNSGTERGAERYDQAHQRVMSYNQIQPALQQLVDYQGRPQRLSTIAAACAMSERSLRRAFRRATGLTFAAFEERVRLRAVIHAVRNSRQPMKAIAANWSFSDTSHFDRWFKQRTGFSPTEFRRRFG